MKLAVLGSDDSFYELTQGADAIEWQRIPNLQEAANLSGISGFFNLDDDAGEEDYSGLSIPVFVNSVAGNLVSTPNVTRINGWKGFLQNETWEIAGNYNDTIQAIIQKLNKKIIITADVPGFISASIIAMIINEAYYAKEEKVSTEEEIDLAMKLGTNYPYGPFEWAKRIGLKNIHRLLESLSKQNDKNAPAPLLTQAIVEL